MTPETGPMSDPAVQPNVDGTDAIVADDAEVTAVGTDTPATEDAAPEPENTEAETPAEVEKEDEEEEEA